MGRAPVGVEIFQTQRSIADGAINNILWSYEPNIFEFDGAIQYVWVKWGYPIALDTSNIFGYYCEATQYLRIRLDYSISLSQMEPPKIVGSDGGTQYVLDQMELPKIVGSGGATQYLLIR